ncbi:hypothetical protein [Butyrivibrio sp. XPD2002]|uniref:hypothetical protein n=1 Tax=Butyrivibrio sp. XPD2002 TaxID=1280665 RepID=UPI0004180B8B|nr:hypothetical protein [Butyrivibrio sp. XPD2002]
MRKYMINQGISGILAMALLLSVGSTNVEASKANSDEDFVVEVATTNDSATDDDESSSLTPTQRNSINMLNYMTSLTQQVNANKGDQIFLESAYNSFDNLYPNSVDTKTQAQISSMMDTIENYRMITVKRKRLEYIHEQQRAQAMRQAVPNPIGLLSAVQSGSLLKATASVLYMAIDSATNYQNATSQADMQFLKDGWELDDSEAAELHNSTKNALSYMFDMVRAYDLPGDYALNKGAVEDFVSWSSKPDSQLVRKISWLETNQSTYAEFGPYWLELAKDYYNHNDYDKCLESIKKYEKISTRIFRKDIDYAQTLPMAIISAKETMDEDEYIELAEKYCEIIHKNTHDDDWGIRYFTAQIYMDLYSITKDNDYVDKAYQNVRENIVVLVDEQKSLNDTYLADVVEVKAASDATKREKKEVKSYNKLMKEERKVAVPPVSEALYLNCDLLFALADKKKIDKKEKQDLEDILHENGDNLFLTQALDERFWFDHKDENLDLNAINVSFEGDKVTIPASLVTDRSNLVITITKGDETKTISDWEVKKVKRPKKSQKCSEFDVTYISKEGDDYDYVSGENITISITPVEESPDKHIDFCYKVVPVKKAFIFDGVEFERVKE